MILRFWLQLVLFLCSTSRMWGAEVGLFDAYQASILRTETVRLAQEKVLQREEALSQAKGGLWPTISSTVSYKRQDSASRPNQTTVQIGAVQPLFRGFGEYSAISQKKTDLASGRKILEKAELDTFLEVTKTFYAVLEADQDLKNLENIAELTKKRVEELKSRSRIGRSRKGEVLSAEAQLASIQAQLAVAEGNRRQAADVFISVTGLEREVHPKDMNVPLPQQLDPLDTFLNSLGSRPDIMAASFDVESAHQSVSMARSRHFPSINATGNYYPLHTGQIDASKWDVGLGMTIPLFEGGVTQSKVDEAHSILRERELTLTQSKRSAEREVRGLYELLAASLSQLKLLSEAESLSSKNYDEQSKDYRLGLVTNLDVLQAMNSYQDTKRLADRTRIQARSQWLRLRTSASGIIQEIP